MPMDPFPKKCIYVLLTIRMCGDEQVADEANILSSKAMWCEAPKSSIHLFDS